MRAAFITGYGDNSVVGYGEIADPTPGEDEALIEVRAAGIVLGVTFNDGIEVIAKPTDRQPITAAA